MTFVVFFFARFIRRMGKRRISGKFRTGRMFSKDLQSYVKDAFAGIRSATSFNRRICKLSATFYRLKNDLIALPQPNGADQIAAAISFCVYACRGCSKISSRLPISTALPSFMTIIRSDIARTAFIS